MANTRRQALYAAVDKLIVELERVKKALAMVISRYQKKP